VVDVLVGAIRGAYPEITGEAGLEITENVVPHPTLGDERRPLPHVGAKKDPGFFASL
jgi:hypothetical protein